MPIRRRRGDMADRARGVLLGLAAGDALAAPLEWLHPDQITARYGGPLRDLVELPPWQRGEWTDEAAMALCLAESLADKGGYDAEDAFARYAMFVRSRPPDMGADVDHALSRSRSAVEARAAARELEGQLAGNGALVRTPPLAIRYHDDRGALDRFCRADAQLTDHDPQAGEACLWLDMTLAALVAERDRPRSSSVAAVQAEQAIDAEPQQLAEEVQSRPGHVLTALRVGFAAAFRHDDPEAAIVFAANLGGDADANAAVAGALAGARFGAAALPERWLDPLVDRARIGGLALRLLRR
ncbi:MAG: ADP-ribosylglycohydrolase family protein [Gaiellales bacterium]